MVKYFPKFGLTFHFKSQLSNQIVATHVRKADKSHQTTSPRPQSSPVRLTVCDSMSSCLNITFSSDTHESCDDPFPSQYSSNTSSQVFFSPQSLFDEYPKVFIVNVDNVGSKQMQQIRISLRGKAVVLMGKNTTIRKALRGHLDQNPGLEKLLPHIKGNIGFIFTKEELNDVRTVVEENKVGCF